MRSEGFGGLAPVSVIVAICVTRIKIYVKGKKRREE